MTRALVPGGPDAMTKGFGKVMPLTVVSSVGMRVEFRVKCFAMGLSNRGFLTTAALKFTPDTLFLITRPGSRRGRPRQKFRD